jgi:ribosome-associated heat shock protein Hsp15
VAEDEPRIRLDKWLWQARFFKTRSLAATTVSGGVRVNGRVVAKPAALVGPGDVLTFSQARTVRVIRVVAPGVRRGPAQEAQALYEDLDPPERRPSQLATPRYDRGGRPTKKDRRLYDKSRPDALE